MTKEGKMINWLNMGLTVYIHFQVLMQIVENLSVSLGISIALILGFVTQMILYYWVYWLGKSKKIKRESVLISGLLLALFLFKGGYEHGLYYAGIMFTSAFFIDRTRGLLILQGLILVLVLNIPFRYSLSPFVLYSDSIDWQSFIGILMNFGVIVTGMWAFTYYQRMNIKLIAMQKENEEAAKILERQRIAQEIHDAIGHSLTSLNMHLEYGISMDTSDSEKVQVLFSNMKSITEEAICNCRRSVKMLKDNESDDHHFNLSQSLEKLKQSVEQENGWCIEGFFHKDLEEAPEYVKNALFTSIREALTNAIKYSGSKRFQYVFEVSDAVISLGICDFGKGAGPFVKSNGLEGIQDRVEALSGDVQFYDDPHRGFCIDINLPRE